MILRQQDIFSNCMGQLAWSLFIQPQDSLEVKQNSVPEGVSPGQQCQQSCDTAAKPSEIDQKPSSRRAFMARLLSVA